jgi:DNA-binding SARP family transcriptional activator
MGRQVARPSGECAAARRLAAPAGGDAIRSDVGGYALRLGASEAVDADHFEQLVDDGEAALRAGAPAQAADLLHVANDLWRGPALQGVDYESYAAAGIARLEERRLAGREAWIEAQLALRHPERVVDELVGLVVEHPHREPFRVQLVRALLDSGRQADALAAYRDARRELGDRGALASLRSLTATAEGVHEQSRPARREIVCVVADVRPYAEAAALDPEALSDLMG